MKHWYQSKMINTNLIAILTVGSAFLGGEISGETAIATVVTNLVNILLRLVTTQAVGAAGGER